MPIRAIAYHPNVVRAKLQMYSLSESAEEKSVGDGIRCPKCGLAFVVVFPILDDLGSKKYRVRLKTLIRDNCNRGNHHDEYLIDDTR
jgi:hypothetical protein